MFMLVSGYALRANPTYPCSTGLDRDNSIYKGTATRLQANGSIAKKPRIDPWFFRFGRLRMCSLELPAAEAVVMAGRHLRLVFRQFGHDGVGGEDQAGH